MISIKSMLFMGTIMDTIRLIKNVKYASKILVRDILAECDIQRDVIAILRSEGCLPD